MTSENLKFETVDGIAHIELQCSSERHTLSLPVLRELAESAARCEHDPQVRTVLLSAPGPYFSVGGDLEEFQAQGERLAEHLREASTWFHLVINRLAGLGCPVVAMVGGMAAGGALSLLCMADVVVCADTARFTFAYSRSGLSPDGGATWFLPRLVGRRRAFELLALNPVLTASEAERLGLVNRVVPDADLEEHGWALARALANGPLEAQGAIKHLLLASATNSLESQLELESRAIAEIGKGPEAAEGLRAFFEKRPAEFHR